MNQARLRVEEAGRDRILDSGEANSGGDRAAAGSGVVGYLVGLWTSLLR